MILRPQCITRTSTFFPYPPRFRSSRARQALADQVELVERGESERQRALAAAAILDRDADPQQFGQMPLDRHDVWIAPDAVHALIFERRPPPPALFGAHQPLARAHRPPVERKSPRLNPTQQCASPIPPPHATHNLIHTSTRSH